jgi:hypothetical protein
MVACSTKEFMQVVNKDRILITEFSGTINELRAG